MDIESLRHNPNRKITRFVYPRGLMTIFAPEVSEVEAQQLGCDMEELHIEFILHATLTGTLEYWQHKILES
jgi:hypothetical protein